MIIDALSNAAKYEILHPLFAEAFDYIQSVDLLTIAVGKYAIGDGLTAIFSDKPGVTEAESVAEFECHDIHIDMQLCISGVEKFGWKPRSTCQHQRGKYNADKDVLFYDDVPDTYFQLTDNQFVIFYPEDVHAPTINVNGENIRKLVIKIRK